MIKRDLVQRLRDTAVPTVELCDEAADAIDRLRLTDAEREAIKEAISCCEDITYGKPTDPESAVTLRGLLERLAR
jgi:hypothetical protein